MAKAADVSALIIEREKHTLLKTIKEAIKQKVNKITSLSIVLVKIQVIFILSTLRQEETLVE